MELNEIIAGKIGSGREYRKTEQIEVRGIVEGEEDRMTVTGYATTFDSEYKLWEDDEYTILEKVDRKAFESCDMSDVIMQYDHAGRVFARMSNGTLRIHTDDHGLRTEADLGGTTIGRELFEEIKGGYSTKMSFGFRVDADKTEVEEDKQNRKTIVHRTITKIGKLYDVSAVSLPANDGTEISARTICDGLIMEIEQERLKARAHDHKVKALKLLLEM